MEKMRKTKKVEVDYIKCVWGLLCSLSSIDQERNNISLFNIIEQITLPKDFFDKQKREKVDLMFPLPYEIVLCWKRTLSTSIFNEEVFADFKIKTVDPSGMILQEVLNPIKFPKNMKRLRVRFVMQGVLASIPGDYVHQIEVKSQNQKDFKKILEIPFEVVENNNLVFPG